MIARSTEHPASLALVVLIVVVLFGYKRLPELAGSVGKSMKVFRNEVRDGEGVSKRSDSVKSDPVDSTEPL